MARRNENPDTEPTDTEIHGRTRRSPSERAQAAVDKAKASVDKIDTKLKKARAEVASLTEERKRADKVLQWALVHPDLPEQPAEEGETTSEQGEAGDETVNLTAVDEQPAEQPEEQQQTEGDVPVELAEVTNDDPFVTPAGDAVDDDDPFAGR